MKEVTKNGRVHLSALVTGGVFGVGLIVSGMTDPTKVFGFLNMTGAWDPSLALVMVGALVVFIAGQPLTKRKSAPLLASDFDLPKRDAPISWRLLSGAVLFGAGWAISGFCPGPALVAFGGLMTEAIIFLPAMLAGMFLYKVTLAPIGSAAKGER